MKNIELEALKKKGIIDGAVVEITDVDFLMESMGYDGLGLDFEIDNNAMTFYKGNTVVEIIYEIIERKGYLGTVKIESIKKLKN